MLPLEEKIDAAIAEAAEELDVATGQFGAFHSAHEGFAVLKEEVDELWEEVKKGPSCRNRNALRQEAVQVAAMALRFIVDVCS